jgi:hypothetical protein
MYTSIVLALTSSLVAASGYESITWQKDYSEARQIGQTEKKPLAVFIGNGAGGQEKVCRDGKLSPELEKMLADSYVCVYVDASTPEGQKMASQFANTKGLGLVLSNRAGDLQAFSHEGDLTAADMSKWVKQYADPSVVVNTTMTNATSQISMYPQSGPMGYQGNVIYGGQGYFSGGMSFGGGCPGGNCGGGGIIRRR